MPLKIPLHIETLNEDGCHVFVEGAAGGKPVRLLLDTGASRTVFDLQTLQTHHPDIHLEENEDLAIGLGTEGMENYMVTIENFVLGNHHLGTISAGALSIDHVNQSYEMVGLSPISGVLGSDLLLRHKAIIDYGKRELVLEKS